MKRVTWVINYEKEIPTEFKLGDHVCWKLPNNEWMSGIIKNLDGLHEALVWSEHPYHNGMNVNYGYSYVFVRNLEHITEGKGIVKQYGIV